MSFIKEEDTFIGLTQPYIWEEADLSDDEVLKLFLGHLVDSKEELYTDDEEVLEL